MSAISCLDSEWIVPDWFLYGSANFSCPLRGEVVPLTHQLETIRPGLLGRLKTWASQTLSQSSTWVLGWQASLPTHFSVGSTAETKYGAVFLCLLRLQTQMMLREAIVFLTFLLCVCSHVHMRVSVCLCVYVCMHVHVCVCFEWLNPQFHSYKANASPLSYIPSPLFLFFILRHGQIKLPRLASNLWPACFSLLSSWDHSLGHEYWPALMFLTGTVLTQVCHGIGGSSLWEKEASRSYVAWNSFPLEHMTFIWTKDSESWESASVTNAVTLSSEFR